MENEKEAVLETGEGGVQEAELVMRRQHFGLLFRCHPEKAHEVLHRDFPKADWQPFIAITCPVTKEEQVYKTIEDVPTETTPCCEMGWYVLYLPNREDVFVEGEKSGD